VPDTDPFVLFEEIRASQEALGTRVDQRGTAAKHSTVVRSAQDRRRRGEQLEILRRPYRRTKPIPPKAAMLDAYADQV